MTHITHRGHVKTEKSEWCSAGQSAESDTAKRLNWTELSPGQGMLGSPAVTGGEKHRRILPTGHLGEPGPADTLILEFYPPELSENKGSAS